MKRSLIVVAAAVAMTGLAAMAQQGGTPAQPGPGAGPMAGPMHRGPMHGPMAGPMAGPMRGGMHGGWFTLLDADKDGKVSKDELAAHFDRVDANKDGFLTPDEMHAHRMAQGGQAFSRLDADGSGSLDRDEVKSTSRLAANFDALDADKDGKLTPDELRSAWAGRGFQRGPRLDTDGDGMISQEEAKNSPRLSANFAAIDANKDGRLTRDEIHAWRHAQRPTATAPVKP